MSDGLSEQLRRAKLDEEIAKLEELAYGPPKENSDNSEQEDQVLDDNEVISPDQSSEFKVELTDDIFNEETTDKDTQPSDNEELAKLRKDYADLQHRFNRYKGSTDRTLFDLRSENSKLNKQVASLIKDNTTLKDEVGKFEGLDEDTRSILGDQASDIIEGLRKEVSSLKSQLVQSDSSKFDAQADQHLKSNDVDFRARLAELVPDLEAMNADQGFNDWLRQPDDYGIQRLATLRSDQARNDYVRVAAFFNEYKSIAKPKPKSRKVEDSIEAHSGVKTSQTKQSDSAKNPSSKGFVKQSEINNFQRDVSKGKYKYDSAKAEAMENKIFKAIEEGKIIADEEPVHKFRLS